MNSMNMYLANYYLDELNTRKEKRKRNRALFDNKNALNHTDLTSKMAQTKIRNLEVNL